MYSSHDQIEINATPEQVFNILSNLHRLPEWYVPSEAINVLSQTPIQPGWQFHLSVRTLGGVLLKALGTVKTFKPNDYYIVWHGKALGIQGHSCWQALPKNGHTLLKHSFEGKGWMLFLSKSLGRNDMTVHQRLRNLKNLVELETIQSGKVAKVQGSKVAR